jgi:DNA-binding MarR family transcriptional regulator
MSPDRSPTRAPELPDRPELPEDAEALAEVEIQFAVLVRHLELLRRRTDASQGLERAEYLLLRTLDARGPLEIRGLAECLGLDPSTAGRQVNALAQQGLVERTTDTADRRRHIISLTEPGRRVMGEVQQRRLDSAAELLQDWTPEEVAVLASSITRYNRAVAARYLSSTTDETNLE